MLESMLYKIYIAINEKNSLDKKVLRILFLLLKTEHMFGIIQTQTYVLEDWNGLFIG